MNNTHKYFFLNNNCVFEKGRINAIIINLENGHSYLLDKEAADILPLSEKGYDLNEIIKILRIPFIKLYSFLNKIKGFDLGDFYQNKVFIDNFKYLTGNDIFMEKTHLGIRLKSLVIEINNKCLLNCINCNRIESEYSFCGCSILNHDKNIEIGRFKEVIEEATKFNLESLYIMGGDPLLSEKDLKELILFSSGIGIGKFSLLSSCLFLNQSLISFLSKYDVEVFVPMYHYEGRFHDSITRTKGSFDKSVRNLSKLSKSGVKVIPIFYEFIDSIDNTSEAIKFMKKLNCASFKIDVIYPRLKKGGNRVSHEKFIEAYNRKLKTTPRLNGKSYLSNKSIYPCMYGKVAIALNGDIIPCQNAKEHVLGNINSDSLSEILKSGLLDKYWYHNKDTIEGCKDCELRYCCNDCLILAHVFEKNNISKNIFCNYFPHKGIWK